MYDPLLYSLLNYEICTIQIEEYTERFLHALTEEGQNNYHTAARTYIMCFLIVYILNSMSNDYNNLCAYIHCISANF